MGISDYLFKDEYTLWALVIVAISLFLVYLLRSLREINKNSPKQKILRAVKSSRFNNLLTMVEFTIYQYKNKCAREKSTLDYNSVLLPLVIHFQPDMDEINLPLFNGKITNRLGHIHFYLIPITELPELVQDDRIKSMDVAGSFEI